MKKTLNKALSLLLAILMIGGATTTLAFAEDKIAYQEIRRDLTDENRILYLDDLDLTDGDPFTVGKNYTNNTYTVTEQNLDEASKTRASVQEDVIKCNLTANEWYYVGVETSLELKADSEYTIEFYAKKLLAHGVGFGWSNKNGTGQYRHGFRTLDLSDTKTQIRQLNSSGWGSVYNIAFANGTTAETNLNYNATNTYKDADGYVLYTMAVKGNVASLYIGNVLVIKDVQFNAKNQSDHLSLFLMNYTNENDAKGGKFGGNGDAISIKDISVYDTAEVFKNVTNAKNGDLLLELDNLDLTDANAFTSGYQIDVTRATWSNADHDGTNSASVEGDIITNQRDKNNWYLVGVDTTLPLNQSSKYTIEFYVKELIDTAVGLGWSNPSTVKAMDQQGFFMSDSGKASNGYDTGISAIDVGWGAEKLEFEDGKENNVWPGYNFNTKYKDADGYVRYTITVDGNKASLYIGGQCVVENAVFDSAQSSYLSLFIKCLPKESNTGSYGGEANDAYKANAACPELKGVEALSVKDIRVWQGHSVRQNIATAVFLDGITTKELSYNENNIITAFPEITEGVAENETVIWTYSKSGANNVVAVAPFEVTSDITFTAKKVKISDNTLVGMQYTAIADNKQNVRFISTIHSLKGSAVGFEITAKYMDKGVLTEQNWDKNCTYVYTAIKATTSSGTVEDITANELGGTYLFALSVDEVPTSIGQIDFYVRSYVVINGEKIYDSNNATRFSMNGGAIDYTAAPLQ